MALFIPDDFKQGNAFAHAFKECAIALLAGAQSLFRLDARIDVHGASPIADDFACLVVHGDTVGGHPNGLAGFLSDRVVQVGKGKALQADVYKTIQYGLAVRGRDKLNELKDAFEFVRPVPQKFFGKVADIQEKAGDIYFPCHGPGFSGECSMAAHGFRQFLILLFHQLSEFFAAVNQQAYDGSRQAG